MRELINLPVFGVITSLAAYEIGSIIHRKTGFSVFNPLLIAIVILVVFFKAFGIPYDAYNKGGQVISFFLGPATVVLAVPLYNKFELFKKNALPVLAGILIGVMSGIFTVVFLSRAFGLNDAIIKSLVPKSITTPIGMVVSKQLGGIPAVTVAVIIVTGIIGSIVGPSLCKLLRINDSIATGTAFGNASHAVGTAKALQIGETEGAMSSLTIGIAGIVTVFAAPILWKLLVK